MMFKALVCDYDGTLASHDRIGAEVVSALARAHAAGVRLVLVTGRTFFELTRVCELLELFDAVVAENGAVLYYPAAGAIIDQAPPPSSRLLAELDRRNINYQAGRVVVSTLWTNEAQVRDALATSGVSLHFVYNRAALLLLPAGISKGTGVRQVLATLGVSFHDALALGDAENDAALFDACGWTACPASALPALKERADWVFPGDNGGAIAQAITGPILSGLLPADRSPGHRIELGWAVETSEPVTIPARNISVLIQGDLFSGKSWLVGALVERLHGQRYAVCVLDPEGDYRVLAQLSGVVWAETRDDASMAKLLAQFDRDPSACVVADLSALSHPDKVQRIQTALTSIGELRRRVGRPHWVVIDEAHYSLHREGVAAQAVGIENKGFCLATYKPSWIRESVLKAIDIFILGRTTTPEELAFLRARFTDSSGGGERAILALPQLPDGEFMVVQSDDLGRPAPSTFRPPPRETPHVRHLRKHVDSKVPSEQCFFFRAADGGIVAVAENLSGFQQVVAVVDEHVLADHARRGDFSRWVFDVFLDRELGTQLRKTEARWARGEIRDLRGVINRLVALRYGP